VKEATAQHNAWENARDFPRDGLNGAREKAREKITTGSTIWFCNSILPKPLETLNFVTWHIDLRLDKLLVLQNENYKTVGDALSVVK